jgi:chromosome segregation ATPase
MAQLPLEVTETLWNLKRQALEIVEEATATEYTLFDAFGETEETLSYLDEMKNVAEEAESLYSRLSNLHLQVVQAQPSASRDLLRLLNQVINTTSARLPALKRSIQEVKQEWNL